MPKQNRKPDHISQEAWDAVDSPPLTERMLRGMRPVRESMRPDIFEKLTKGRGPQKTPTKEAVSLRLDRDVVEHFRAQGPGWQTKINRVLRESAKQSPGSSAYVTKTSATRTPATVVKGDPLPPRDAQSGRWASDKKAGGSAHRNKKRG